MHIRLLAKNMGDMTPALRLRYDRYEEYVVPNFQRVFTELYDFIPTGHVFGAFGNDGKLIATMRINETPLPCTPYFDNVESIPGKTLEVSRLMTDPSIKMGLRTKVLAQLVREAVVSAFALDADTILTTSKPKTLPFYKRLFGFEEIAVGTEYYPFVDRISLLRCDIMDCMKLFRGHSVISGITNEMIEQRRCEMDTIALAA